MKETTVYVDKFPTQCLDCRFAYDGRCQAKENGESYCVENCRRSDCPLIDIKTHDRELVKEVCEKIIKFINELAWKDIQYDAFQSTIGELCGSTSAIPRYAKKYFDLWKEMFNEDLEEYKRSLRSEN